MMVPMVLLLVACLMLRLQGPSSFIGSAFLWSHLQHPMAFLLTAAIDKEPWTIHLRHQQRLGNINRARLTLVCLWLLHVSTYIAFVNRFLDIGPDLEAVILGSAPLVVPHELYHGRRLQMMILLVCWKEVCLRELHLWLKGGLHVLFYALFM
ncbi:hypothetical protein V8C42DRAFT_333449 [Trichoderma barbatum]